MISISTELNEAWNELDLLYEEWSDEDKEQYEEYQRLRRSLSRNGFSHQNADFYKFIKTRWYKDIPKEFSDKNGNWAKNRFLYVLFYGERTLKIKNDKNSWETREYKGYYDLFSAFSETRELLLNSAAFRLGPGKNTELTQAEAKEKTQEYEEALDSMMQQYEAFWHRLPSKGFRKYLESNEAKADQVYLARLNERCREKIAEWQASLELWKNYVSNGTIQAQKLRQWKAEHNNQDLIYYFVGTYFSLNRILKSKYIKATLEDSRSSGNLGRETLDEPTLQQLDNISDKIKKLPYDPNLESLRDRLYNQNLKNGQLKRFYKNYVSLTTDNYNVPARRPSRYSCGVILSVEKLAQAFETNTLLKAAEISTEYNFSRDNKTNIEITDIGLANTEIPVVTDTKEVITKVLPRQYFLTISTFGSVPITEDIYKEIKERFFDSGMVPQPTKEQPLAKKCVPGTFYSTRIIKDDIFSSNPSATGQYLDDKADEIKQRLSGNTEIVPKKRKIVIADLSPKSQDWLFNESLLNEFELRLALDPNELLKQQIDNNGKKEALKFNIEDLVVGIICDSTIYSFLNPEDTDFNINLRQFKTYNNFEEKVLAPRNAKLTRFNGKTAYKTKTDQITVSSEEAFDAFCDIKDYIKERIQSDPTFMVKYIPAEHESIVTKNTNLIESPLNIMHGFTMIFEDLIGY